MIFLVVASPCALVASMMPAILSGISNGARNGILFKGGAHLESMGELDVVAFDKTGTLTQGRPVVTDVSALGRLAEARRAAAADRGVARTLVRPPACGAIVAAAERARAWSSREPADVQEIAGLRPARIGRGQPYCVGSVDFIARQGIEMPGGGPPGIKAATRRESHRGRRRRRRGLGGLCAPRHPAGAGAAGDPPPQGARRAESDHAHGRHPNEAGRPSAPRPACDQVYASLLPEDKVRIVQELAASGTRVAMVGDGVNDAPALASASVGIAMGGAGSDVALETADVVLVSDDLTKLPYAIALGRRVERIVKQNIAFSLQRHRPSDHRQLHGSHHAAHGGDRPRRQHRPGDPQRPAGALHAAAPPGKGPLRSRRPKCARPWRGRAKTISRGPARLPGGCAARR